MNQSAQRRVGLMALAMALLLTSGCAPGSPVASGESPSDTPADQSTPSPTPTPTPSSSSELNLSFGTAEALITAGWDVAWADPFAKNARFSVLSADDGNGSWSYKETSNGCRIFFYQGAVTDLDMTQDDRTISDAMLATMAMQRKPTAEDMATIKANAADDWIPLTDGGELAVRGIGGRTSSDGTVVIVARMIGTLGGGLTLMVDCPAGTNASDEYASLTDELLRVVVTS